MTNQVKVAKALAKQITAALSENGQDLSHGVALEVVAKALGARNWHAFLAEQQTAAKSGTVAAESPVWSPAQGPMSDEQYARYEGNRCPICGHRHSIEGGDVDVDGPSAWSEVSCSNCGSSWNDNFSLVGWGEAERGDGARSKNEAQETGFLYALQLWLSSKEEDFDDDKQLILDDLVIDSVRGNSLAALNSTGSHSYQEEIIVDVDAKASNINNDGVLAQLKWLCRDFDTQEGFADFLAIQFKLSRKTLNL